jgi:alkanesulfonate monooxygenase SsuD/methylene tetrahydromethanopterin reductase-like flavin-dependent oxidoreductase (luciferase family)
LRGSGGRRTTPAARPPAAITPALFVSVLVTDGADGGRQALEDYSLANYGLPLEQLQSIQAVVAGSPEHVAEQLGRYITAGARHLVCRIAASSLRSQREQLERIAAILPVLRGGQPVSG